LQIYWTVALQYFFTKISLSILPRILFRYIHMYSAPKVFADFPTNLGRNPCYFRKCSKSVRLHLLQPL
jgi:hypothetical protein